MGGAPLPAPSRNGAAPAVAAQAALPKRLPPEQVPAEDRWIALLVMTRLLAAAAAVGLLLAHRVTDYDYELVAVTVVWTAITLLAASRSQRVRTSALAWAIDGLAALFLIFLSGDWRSPFYLLLLTTLVLPSTRLRWRGALTWTIGFTIAYWITALITDQLPADTLIDNPVRLETLATHLLIPLIVGLALSFAGRLLERLREERERSQQLAIHTERQRIAWELHDSAKQRVHAAHLLMSALEQRLEGADHELMEAALAELRGATADMETSIAELRAPVDGRPVGNLLRERAAELSRAGGLSIEVEGDLPELPATVGAHVFRIGTEALTNAVRHAQCTRVEVRLGADGDTARMEIVDDGVGLPEELRPESHGLRAMHARAERIHGMLDVSQRADGRGTRVELLLPLPDLIHAEREAPTP
jgi:signal transduction histidine kinase